MEKLFGSNENLPETRAGEPEKFSWHSDVYTGTETGGTLIINVKVEYWMNFNDIMEQN